MQISPSLFSANKGVISQCAGLALLVGCGAYSLASAVSAVVEQTQTAPDMRLAAAASMVNQVGPGLSARLGDESIRTGSIPPPGAKPRLPCTP